MTEFAITVTSNNTDSKVQVHKYDTDGNGTLKGDVSTSGADWVYAVAHSDDLQTIVIELDQESSSLDPRFYTSTDYGETWNIVTDADLNAELLWPGYSCGLTYDGTDFWAAFTGNGSFVMFKSSDGVNWAEQSVTGVDSVFDIDTYGLEFYNGEYYLISSTDSSTGTRFVGIWRSTDGLTWSKLDDTSISDYTSQYTNTSRVFRANGENIVLTRGSSNGFWNYKHTPGSGSLTRTAQWNSGANPETVFTYNNDLYAIGDIDGSTDGLYISTDYAATWTFVNDLDSFTVWPNNYWGSVSHSQAMYGTSEGILMLNYDNKLWAAPDATGGWVEIYDLTQGGTKIITPLYVFATANYNPGFAPPYTEWENVVNLEEI